MKHPRRELRFLLIGGAVLLCVGAAFMLWRTHRQSSVAMAPAASSERKVLYWHDPMVPNARFDKPGKSPFMDMPLVPVYADGTGADSNVRIASNVSQSLGVRLGKVERIRWQPHLTAVGSVAFDDRLLKVVSARVEGIVLQLHVRAPLEAVRRGQALATVQVPAWIEAQQEYLALLDAGSQAALGLRGAARERLRVLGMPDAAVERLESRREFEATTVITAPIDGVLSELDVREGTTFMAGTPLFRISGLGSVWVNARIPEAQLSSVHVGAQVNASASAWPGEIFPGKVIALLPEVEAATRTLTARVALDNRGGKLMPGMFVSLALTGAGAGEALVVPDEAVITTGTRTVVVIANADSSFGVANVRVGGQQDGQTVILEGLTEGQSVVVSGQFLIDSEASLKSSLSRLESTPASVKEQPPGAMVHHLAEGVITAIDGQSVTVDHGPVASMQWPAMTMRFQLPPQGVPSELKVGDRVKFSFMPAGTAYRIETIERAGIPPKDATQ